MYTRRRRERCRVRGKEVSVLKRLKKRFFRIFFLKV